MKTMLIAVLALLAVAAAATPAAAQDEPRPELPPDDLEDTGDDDGPIEIDPEQEWPEPIATTAAL